MHDERVKFSAIVLRKKGNTYKSINHKLGLKLPKGTLSYWLRNVKVPADFKHEQALLNQNYLARARIVALKKKLDDRENLFSTLRNKNDYLADIVWKNVAVQKLTLAMLYLGEGSRILKRGALMFGNSDPVIIKLFLSFLRNSYNIKEDKFRCTVQCRADQDIESLESFWEQLTEIPRKQFYKAQVDKRTSGKPSRKKNYKGVCRIDYFSAEILFDIVSIIEVLHKGH